MTPAIVADALTVRAGDKSLLKGISLSIDHGETVALVGPNGAGKSTMLRALAGEIAPGAGKVLLQGRDPRGWPPRELALRRAVLSQSVTVTFPFTVAEIVRMGAGDRPTRALGTLIDEALAEVDLDGFQERIIGTMSGGEQQRVHFARVLVQLACGEHTHGPGILLLDEPTASLDLRHQLDFAAALAKRAACGTTIVTVLHDLNLATLLGGRVVVLDHGRIAADGTPKDTITDEVLGDVFGIVSAVGKVPDHKIPFVLPHSARKPDSQARPDRQ